jgi:uncharacterized membrane protein
MHPFDPKAALLAKHAQHVVLIHFPIALFLTGVAFDVAARWTKKTTFAVGANLNLLAATVFVLPTIATGIAAWQWQLGGHKLKGILLLHFVLGCTSGLLIFLVGWIHFRGRQAGMKNPAGPAYTLALELVTMIAVILTGHVGGFLSGVNVAG